MESEAGGVRGLAHPQALSPLCPSLCVPRSVYRKAAEGSRQKEEGSKDWGINLTLK